jgi:chromosome partitioning protein
MSTKKARILSCIVSKGGVLKTSSVTSLSGVILKDKKDGIKNKKILLIDLDTQGNVSNAFGKNPDLFNPTIYDVLIGKNKPEDAIVNVYEDENGSIDLLPSNDDLELLEMTVLTNVSKYGPPLELLKKSCTHLVDKYDYILFDTPPNTGLLVLNLFAFNGGVPVEVLVPFQPENFSFRGLMKVFEKVESMKSKNNPNLNIKGVFGTLINSRTTVHKGVLKVTRDKTSERGYHFFDTYIPKSVAAATAFAYAGLPVTLTSENKSNKLLINSYQKLWEEIR